MREIRCALRSLARTPALLATAVISLALGIGANTAVFTVVNAMLFKPLPVQDPDRLVAVYTVAEGSSFPDAFSYPDYLDYRGRPEVFADLVGHSGVALSLAGGGNRPELVWGELVTGNYFTGLGVSPAFGRVFSQADDQRPGGHPVVVLSHNFWERHFNKNPSILGTALTLNGHAYTVVGVAAFGFSGTRFLGFLPDIWIPVAMHAEVLHEGGHDRLTARGWRWLNVNGRLQRGVGLGEAAAALDTFARQAARSYPETNRGVSIRITPGGSKTQPLPGGERILSVISTALMGVVGLALLVACANVANLFMARAASRRREVAVRLALGASKWRLVRMVLTESLMVSIPSGALGLLLASWLMESFATNGPPLDFPTINPAYDLAMDSRVFAFTLAVSVATGVLFGLLPAVHASRGDVLPSLKGEATAVGRNPLRLGARGSLVIAQVGLSLMLLVATGLFVRSAHHARRMDPGFETRQILIASVNPGIHGYSEHDGLDLYRRILERGVAIPGVQSLSLASVLPLDDSARGGRVLAEGYVPRSPDESTDALFTEVAPGYFATMSTHIVRGRPLDDRDGPDALRTAVVNEAMASKYWPGQDPIGRRFRLNDPKGMVFTIVGVAETGKYITLGEEATPYFFLPLWQNYASRVRIVLRTRLDPKVVVAGLHSELQAIDPSLPLFGIKSMEQFLERSLWGTGAAAGALGSLGLFVLVLAAVGVHGIVSWSVAQRTHEIGIRMALGASARSVRRSIVNQGLVLAIVGVVLGSAGALALARVLANLLFGVEPADPPTFVAMALLLMSVAVAAAYLPARRAALLDPAHALRHE